MSNEADPMSIAEDFPREPHPQTIPPQSILRPGVRRSLGFLLIAIVGFPVAWTVCIMGSIVFFAFQMDDTNADAAIVLGAAVAYSLPTPVFEQRIRHAVRLYQDRKVRKLVLTGGVGYGDTLAESEVARDYCLKRGVPAMDMLLETRSHSTIGNLLECKSLLEANGIRKVLLVSDPLHMRRALTLAHDLGIEAYPSPTPTSKFEGFKTKSEFLFKETYFYSRYLLLERAKTRMLINGMNRGPVHASIPQGCR